MSNIEQYKQFCRFCEHFSPHATDLDIYLQSKVEKVIDPLKWWYNNCHIYPTLYHMALDYLSIPGEFLSISFVL